MDAQQIELEIPGLRRQKNHQKLPTKNHQKHQKTAFKKSFGLYDFSHVVRTSNTTKNNNKMFFDERRKNEKWKKQNDQENGKEFILPLIRFYI